jgi:predicted TIM-barrel fold metal-dependent hydrolase
MKTSKYVLLFVIVLQSCGSYYTIEDYYDVPKIDAHIHYNYANPVLLQQAEKDNFRLITVNVETPANPHIDVQESLAIELMNKYKPIFSFLSTFGSNDWDSDEWTGKTIERINISADKGASGVKIWKTFGMQLMDADSNYIFIDDQQLSPVFSHMENHSIPLLAHIGEPKNCWLPLDEMTTKNDQKYFAGHPEYHMYLHPEKPSYEKIMNSRDRILADHGKLKVVGAHFGSIEWNLDSLAYRFEEYPNFAVDMAARIGHMHYHSERDYEKTRQFFVRYHDRILYGTDMGMNSEIAKSGDGFHEYWFNDWQYLATDEEFESRFTGKKVRGLKLPKNVIDDIYFNNSVKWYPKIGF